MAEEFDNIRVVQINGGDDDGADITLQYNGKRIIISVFGSPESDSGDSSLSVCPIETRITRLLNKAVIATHEDYEDLIDEVLDAILHLGGPSFSEAAPPTSRQLPAGQDLQSFLYPESLYFQLQTIDGKPSIFPISAEQGLSAPDDVPEPRLDSAFQASDQLSCFSAKKIIVQDVFLSGNGLVGRVQVAGREMLCKARRAGLWDSGLEHELATLQRIQEAVAAAGVTVRVPSLYGYITHADSGTVIGLLREWVPSGSYGETLRDVDVPGVPLNVREKWADQIRQTVADLHSMGIIWGDGKPSDVIVDKNDDVALIDFGGGWSRGWVDEHLAETVEGDDQAVDKTVQLLDI